MLLLVTKYRNYILLFHSLEYFSKTLGLFAGKFYIIVFEILLNRKNVIRFSKPHFPKYSLKLFVNFKIILQCQSNYFFLCQKQVSLQREIFFIHKIHFSMCLESVESVVLLSSS